VVRVKVCGITTPEDIAVCVRAGADALGFIFAESPCSLTVERAAVLAQLVPPFVAKVGVFARNPPRLIRQAAIRCGLDYLQFSGGEPPEFCGSFGKPTIVVMNESGFAYGRQEIERARAAALMIDVPKTPLSTKTRAPVPIDVASAARRESTLPFILAGGLTPDNVAGAVAAVRPWAVDVRSGVERLGCKDAGLVRSFVENAKAALT
jgi:phosphoribosylanthranilate isomerase